MQLPRIKKIVAFACGSLVLPYDLASINEISAVQHAIMLTLRDCLAAKQPGTSIEYRAQDIDYSDVDKQVLGEVGIATVDDPYGFLEVDEDTVVFAQYPSVPICQIIADIARPAMMIWRKIGPEPPRFGVMCVIIASGTPPWIIRLTMTSCC